MNVRRGSRLYPVDERPGESKADFDIRVLKAMAWWEGYLAGYDWNQNNEPDWSDNPYSR